MKDYTQSEEYRTWFDDDNVRCAKCRDIIGQKGETDEEYCEWCKTNEGCREPDSE